MNQFSVVGRVLRSPTVEETGNGTKIAHLIIEAEKEVKGKDGFTTETFEITCFKNLAEYSSNLRIGDLIGIAGVLSANNYKKSDGVIYYTPQLLANKIVAITKY